MRLHGWFTDLLLDDAADRFRADGDGCAEGEQGVERVTEIAMRPK